MHNVLAGIQSKGGVPSAAAAAAPPAAPRATPPSSSTSSTDANALPYTVVKDGVELDERDGNEFHLAVVLRKYTSAKLGIASGRGRYTFVEDRLLWDALGLLRSLRYDVEQFNAAAAPPAARGGYSRSEVRYLCYRLMRQALAFGVRLPKPGERVVRVRGLDELIVHVEAGAHADKLAVARGTVARGVVDFESLAELFAPGADLVDHGAGTGLYGVPTAVRVRACYYGRGKSLFGVVSTFYAALEFVVSVGDRYAVVESHQMIAEFQGTRSTTSGLDFWVRLAPALREALTARGELYRRVSTGHAFVEHGPGAFIAAGRRGDGAASNDAATAAAGSASKARGAGRMMVDVSAAWARGVHCARTGGEACEAVQATLRLVARMRRASGHRAIDLEYYGAGAQAQASDDAGSLELLLIDELPGSLLWRTWPAVAGFSFAVKAWGVALVDGLRDARFDARAFERLVLPRERKRLIEALVLSHDDDARETADLIAGKGEGSIFLLHGPPGVGKTLTAEAIAELLRRPLYSVSMGELGTTPAELETNLADILALATPWRALVLIDEAEMLLERRTKSDLVRNAMVCVMLRLLEYYQGVLFLTSNRVEALDPAFESRVQCALEYAPLSAASRAQVWRNLLEARGLAAAAESGTVDVDALAVHALNGRQIKNVLQLALALARRDGTDLTHAHLETTLNLSMAFSRAVGGDDEGRGRGRRGARAARGFGVYAKGALHGGAVAVAAGLLLAAGRAAFGFGRRGRGWSESTT